MNLAIIKGITARPPEIRDLSGHTMVSLELTVPASDGRTAEMVPVAWFDAPPAAAGIETDTEVVVIGRVRRRFFRAAGATQSRTEVVADQVVPARQAKRVARLVVAALGAAEAEFTHDGPRRH